MAQPVEIPAIQRDYAQGRQDDKSRKVRNDFLMALFKPIIERQQDSNSPHIELDFIYGYMEGEDPKSGSFIPIDGQQRLTTLWLLYWFLAAKEGVPQSECAWLNNFGYKTRHGTKVFCERLLQFRPTFREDKLSHEIKDQNWYFETWDFDPGIKAMLVMLDAIENLHQELQIGKVWDRISGEACPFLFYRLDMDQVGLTDDLYIKMNSRGKALTDFEYFKAYFAGLLTNETQRNRFEVSVDQTWMETIWKMVLRLPDGKHSKDIATLVDERFLRLFNFITHVSACKKALKYLNTEESASVLKAIYEDEISQNVLFDILDAICKQEAANQTFWASTFYFGEKPAEPAATRLFFPGSETNLLYRCMANFHSGSNFSMPEQILLHACLTHLTTPCEDFNNRIRVLRNLVVNSVNELRADTLGKCFQEAEDYVKTGNLSLLGSFRKSQWEEEKRKSEFLKQQPEQAACVKQLENSNLLRGSISLLDFDEKFSNRAKVFWDKFESVNMEYLETFIDRANLLLCFGDYTQEESSRTRLMSPSTAYIRSFLASQGHNREHFKSNTKPVMAALLDYFVANPDATIKGRIQEQLEYYKSAPKDWRYYFIKYPSFRHQCNQGFYEWKEDAHYPSFKMREWKKTGYHWDPFLYELHMGEGKKLGHLDNYGNELYLSSGTSTVQVTCTQQGFQFKSPAVEQHLNTLFGILMEHRIISSNGELTIQQNAEGVDMEDRIEKFRRAVTNFIDQGPTS